MRGLILGILVIGICGCSDGEMPRMQSHWLRPLEGHEIVPLSVTRHSGAEEESLPFRSRYGIAYVGDLGIRLSVSQASYSTAFALDLMNDTNAAIHILWPDARYLDEIGIEHRVFAQPMNPLPGPDVMGNGTLATVAAAGERINFIVAPIYKASTVRYDFYERGAHHAPLIPTDLTNLQRFPDEAAVKTYVQDLAERRVPVKLLVPIMIDGSRHTYLFSFVVRQRSGDADGSAPPVSTRPPERSVRSSPS